MNKLWIVPIATFLILSIGLFVGLSGFVTTTEGNEQIIVNSASLDESQMAFTNGFLSLNINATFLEDIESIKIDGVLYDKDGSRDNVDFNYCKPDNGLKNHQYLLKCQSSLIGGLKDINLDYLELTIKTTNKEGKSKEIKLNITSDGQVTSNQGSVNLNSGNKSDSSNNTKSDAKPTDKSNSDSSSNNGMTASKAKKIAQNAIGESGAYAGTPYKSGNNWIVKIYDKNGKFVDLIGVEPDGHTYRA